MRNGRDLTKVFDPKGRLIAVLNFNNMIPVDSGVIQAVDLGAKESDGAEERAYKALMRNQIEWCNAHAGEIVGKANRLYSIVMERPEKFRGLVGRCCDFSAWSRCSTRALVSCRVEVAGNVRVPYMVGTFSEMAGLQVSP